jgi:hypothetical protein
MTQKTRTREWLPLEEKVQRVLQALDGGKRLPLWQIEAATKMSTAQTRAAIAQIKKRDVHGMFIYDQGEDVYYFTHSVQEAHANQVRLGKHHRTRTVSLGDYNRNIAAQPDLTPEATLFTELSMTVLGNPDSFMDVLEAVDVASLDDVQLVDLQRRVRAEVQRRGSDTDI